MKWERYIYIYIYRISWIILLENNWDVFIKNVIRNQLSYKVLVEIKKIKNKKLESKWYIQLPPPYNNNNNNN